MSPELIKKPQNILDDHNNHISINQIGDELEECILKNGKNIHINIRYPIYQDFELKTEADRNRIRLDDVNAALQKIASSDKKLDIYKLETIKKKIIEQDFKFEFIYKTHINKKIPVLVGKVIIQPKTDRFDFYISIEDAGQEKCRLLLYGGKTTDFYIADFFFYGKWKSPTVLIIKGKDQGIEIHILIDECKAKYKNFTKYKKPPNFELMKAEIRGDASIINFEPN